MMPPCGTFHYVGVVPLEVVDGEPVPWVLTDPSNPPVNGAFEPLFDNRLVGLSPRARMQHGWFVLTATERLRAEVQEVAIGLGQELLNSLRPGDRMELIRTATADLAVSVTRADDLHWAAGALSTVSLPSRLVVTAGGRTFDMAAALTSMPVPTWVDVSVGGERVRFHDGMQATVGPYQVSVNHSYRDGMPGDFENLAITRECGALHAAALRAAVLLDEKSGNMAITRWSPEERS